MTVADRIKIKREAANLSQEQLAEKMGLSSKTSITRIEKSGNNVSLKNIERIAKILGCNIEYLMGFEEEGGETVPLLGKVAAGKPILAEEQIIGTIDVPSAWSNRDEYFGLQIKGESMEPKISDKDIVLVHKQDSAESGDIVIATINGDDAVCKRLMIYGENVVLRSFNPVYDDIDVTGMEDFHIIGKVIESRRRY